ncbi:alpha-galactosidase precursor [Coniella lustricola]|uniref:Alpha-galactosidase n=1 Tax=Coniella lustricola TaxID=2025994 RepID=A0A2T3A4W8_9PEZI|nr:alpha-galactosidase precursor [Coniella lustricola]
MLLVLCLRPLQAAGFTLLLLLSLASATTVRTSTPVMGWDSYNYYNCYPSQDIIETNAAALVSLGLSELGYTYVTTDCGWTADARDPLTGQLVWNETLFPSGAVALGDYIHGLGLKFGVYSGAGYWQCGSTDDPASLGHEALDAQSFAAWGADSLKYDNCYANSTTTAADYTGTVSGSPMRFDTMYNALNAVSRDIVYQVCQWGVGEDIETWAPPIANSWRISNDIYNAWRSIWRITNQVIPYARVTSPTAGHADMDMLIVGLQALSTYEEQFHFGMWAINKSPLVLGSALANSLTPAASLAIVSNKNVIAINQDSLGAQAELVRRYTTAQWDLWQGALSGGRQVIGLANWYNGSQSVTVDFAADLGIASAVAQDAWTGDSVGTLSGSYTTTLQGHELRLLILTNVVNATAGIQEPVAYYTAATQATLAGNAVVVDCPSGQCLPAGVKVGDIGEGDTAASVTFSGVKATTSGTKLIGVDFINYDVALDTAWALGDNTRNMTIAVNEASAVNGERFAFPISGGDWYDTGRLYVYVDGFVAGASNKVVFTSYNSTVTWAPDLVGFEVYEVN